MVKGQSKLYQAGRKKPAAGGTVKSGTQEGRASSRQGGKTHAVKNRTVNHGRRK
jgi:hypothetical protein